MKVAEVSDAETLFVLPTLPFLLPLVKILVSSSIILAWNSPQNIEIALWLANGNELGLQMSKIAYLHMILF